MTTDAGGIRMISSIATSNACVCVRVLVCVCVCVCVCYCACVCVSWAFAAARGPCVLVVPLVRCLVLRLAWAVSWTSLPLFGRVFLQRLKVTSKFKVCVWQWCLAPLVFKCDACESRFVDVVVAVVAGAVACKLQCSVRYFEYVQHGISSCGWLVLWFLHEYSLAFQVLWR